MSNTSPTIVKKIRTLAQIADDLRHGKDFSITRLTLLKSLCSGPEDTATFALHLAKKTQQAMKAHRRPSHISRMRGNDTSSWRTKACVAWQVT